MGTIGTVPLLSWPEDKSAICRQISASSGILAKAPLKILLKTKDETEMLGLWLRHHQSIVGLENIVVFDNGSKENDVLNIYRQYKNNLNIFRYDTHFDLIHHPTQFPELYQALRESCQYFVFLDTDEFLVLFDGESRFHHDQRLAYFLLDHPDHDIFPATSFQNEIGHGDKFSLYQPVQTLSNGLKWGKPILSSALCLDGMINHNTQVRHGLYRDPLIANFFLLHVSRLFPMQRVKANLRKLVANAVLSEDQGVEDLLAMDLDALPYGVEYAKAIRQMTHRPDELGRPPGECFEITPEGRLRCDAPWKRDVLRDFVSNPMKYAAPLLTH